MANLGEANVDLNLDTKKFEAELRAALKDLKDIQVIVHPVLAKGSKGKLQKELNGLDLKVKVTPTLVGTNARNKLQAELKALRPPLTVKVDPRLDRSQAAKELQQGLSGIDNLGVKINSFDSTDLTAKEAAAVKRLDALKQSTLKTDQARLRTAIQFLNVAEKIRANSAKELKDVEALAQAESRTRATINRERLTALRLQVAENNEADKAARILADRRSKTFSLSRTFLEAFRSASQLDKLKFDNINKFLGNAIAGETLLNLLGNIFKSALNLRKTALQLGTAFATTFTAGIQGVGALVAGLDRAVALAGVLAGVGLISIAVKFLLEDADVKASFDNLKSTFKSVITESAASLKPVLTGFFDDISAGLRKQQPAFTAFFDKISGPLQRVGQAFTNFLNSEQFVRILGRIGDVTAKFLDGFATRLPGIINGLERIGVALHTAAVRIREAFGGSIFKNFSVDKVVTGIEHLTDALVKAGPGVVAFKKAFGQFIDGAQSGLTRVTASIGQFGPQLFAALGPISSAIADDLGKIIAALIKFAAEVLPKIQGPLIKFANVFSDNLVKALDDFDEPFAKTVNHALELGTALAPLLPQFARTAKALEPIIGSFTKIAIALAPAITEIAKFVATIAEAAAPIIQPFTDALVFLAKIVGKALYFAFKLLNDSGLAKFIGIAVGVILAARRLSLIFKILEKVLGPVGKLFTSLGEKFPALGRAFDFISNIFSKFRGIVEKLAHPIQTVKGLFEKLGSSADGIKGKFAGLGEFFKGVGERIKAPFASLGEFFGRIGTTIGGFASRIKGFFSGFKIGGLGDLGKTFGGLAETIGKVLGPLGKVIGLISRVAGVVGVVIFLIENWRTIWDALKKSLDTIIGTFNKIVDGLGRIKDGIGQVLSGDIAGGLGNIFGGLGDILLAGLQGVFEGLKGSVGTLWTLLWSFLEGLPILGGLFTKIHELFSKGFETLKGAFSGFDWSAIWNGIKTAAQNAWNKIKEIFDPSKLFSNVPSFGEIWDNLKLKAQEAWNFITGLFSNFSLPSFPDLGAVWDTLKQKAQEAWDFITGLFSNFSLPSFPDLSGTFDGLRNAAGGAVDFVTGKIGGLGSTLGGIGSTVSNALSGAASSIRTAIGGAVDFVSEKLGGLVSKVAEIGGKIKSFFTGQDSTAGNAVATEAGNQAAEQVRIQSEAILKALQELGPKVQAQMQQVTAIVAQSFVGLGTAIGTAVTGISTQVATALAGLAITMGTTLTTIFTTVITQITAQTTTVLTQITTLATTLTTTLTATLSTVSTTLATTFSTLGTNLITAFTGIFVGLQAQATTFFTATLPATVQGGVDGLTAALTAGLSQGFTAAFAAVGPIVQSSMDAAFATAGAAASNGMQSVVAAVQAGVAEITAALEPLVQSLPDVFQRAFDRARQIATDGVNALVQAIRDGVARILAVAPEYYNAGATIGQRLADGMRSKVGEVRAAANELAAAAAAPMPHSPAKEGPLSGKGDPLHSGRVIVERLVQGLKEREPQLREIITKLMAEFARRQGQLGVQGGFAGLGGFSFGQGNGAVNGQLSGNFDRSIGGRILQQDTKAGISSGGRGSVLQIRPGNINVTVAGVNDPREFINSLSRELLTHCVAR